MLQGAFRNKKKIEPPYSSNLGEALEAFLAHLMPIRKGHHVRGKQGIEVCDAAFIGANGDFPGKSSECSSAISHADTQPALQRRLNSPAAGR